MTTHRRYYFEVPGVEGHEKVLHVLQHYCEVRWWYNEPTVEGSEYGTLSFSYTVSGRDQWFVHKRAMELSEIAFRAVGIGPKKQPEPLWEPLAPHTNRGRFRVPADG